MKLICFYFSKEERLKRENKILGQFREMVHEKLKK